MLKATLSIEITLVAPFITKSSDVGAFGVDAPLARTPDGNNFSFPRKQIKGCLLQALNEIADIDTSLKKETIYEWLGRKSDYEEGNGSSVEPNRGKLFFSDFVTFESGDNKTATRISIDPER